ncbi:hypothetical protein AURDEDRAFT_165773 [Auricularia subglabra TFB-10046 SS5]|nr:hypothetical protein AURDEDRAFT_165773 [Auricularia subglabra TFB-10046 SS5]
MIPGPHTCLGKAHCLVPCPRRRSPLLLAPLPTSTSLPPPPPQSAYSRREHPSTPGDWASAAENEPSISTSISAPPHQYLLPKTPVPSQDRHDLSLSATTTLDLTMWEPESSYTVQRILDRRVRHGVTEYLCWWAGCTRSQASWETAEALGNIQLIIAFEVEQHLRAQTPRVGLADRIRDPSLSPTSPSPRTADGSSRYSPTTATFGDSGPRPDAGAMQIDTARPLTLAERIGSPTLKHQKLMPHVFTDKVGDYLWIVDGFTKMSALVAGEHAPRYVADFYVVPSIAPFVNDDGTRGHCLELLATRGSPLADILRDEDTHASVAYFADDIVMIRWSSAAPMTPLA